MENLKPTPEQIQEEILRLENLRKPFLEAGRIERERQQNSPLSLKEIDDQIQRNTVVRSPNHKQKGRKKI